MKQIRVLIETVLLMGIAYLIYEIMFFVYSYLIYKGASAGWAVIDITGYRQLEGYEEVALNYVKDHPLEYTLLCWLVLGIIFLLVALPSKQKLSNLFHMRNLSIGNGLASVFVGLGLVFAINGSIRFASEATGMEFAYLSDTTLTVYSMMTLFVIIGLITPIFEELFFRGLILSRLHLGFGPIFAVVISSILFSVSHLNIIQGIYVFPVGLLAGYLVIKTGSIQSSIWLHVVYNMVNIYLAKIDFFSVQ